MADQNKMTARRELAHNNSSYGNVSKKYFTYTATTDAIADVIHLCTIPAGAKITGLKLIGLLTSGGSATFQVGYKKVHAADTLTADPDAFYATGTDLIANNVDTYATFYETTVDIYLTATVEVAALTGGTLEGFVEYIWEGNS